MGYSPHQDSSYTRRKGFLVLSVSGVNAGSREQFIFILFFESDLCEVFLQLQLQPTRPAAA